MFTNEQIAIVAVAVLAFYLWNENKKAKEALATVHNEQVLDWVDYRHHHYVVNTNRMIGVGS